MKAALIKRHDNSFYPFSKEDIIKVKRFTPGKITLHDIKGKIDPRSYQQLKLWFACCRTLANNTENQNLDTVTKVHFVMKMRCRWIEHILNVQKGCPFCGNMIDINQIIPKSFSYENCEQPEANIFVNNGLHEIARELGITKDELVNNTIKYYL